MQTQPKEMRYRISLPSEKVETTTIGKAKIEWNKCILFTDGTKKFIKYFKSKKDDKGNQVALRQTYTTYLFGDEVRAFRTVVKTNPITKEIISFVRGNEACRNMLTDFNMLGVTVKESVAPPQLAIQLEGKRWSKTIHLGV